MYNCDPVLTQKLKFAHQIILFSILKDANHSAPEKEEFKEITERPILPCHPCLCKLLTATVSELHDNTVLNQPVKNTKVGGKNQKKTS